MRDSHVSILIVDDEPDMVELLRRAVSRELGWTVLGATSGTEGLRIAEEETPPLVLLDIKMPDLDGIEVLGRLMELPHKPTVVMMTAYGVIELAVESIRRGAYDFITKPFDYARVVHTLRQAWEHRKLLEENLSLKLLVKKTEAFQDIVGSSIAMKKVVRTIEMAAPTDATVLITGESGTGKELVARAIHRLSHRSQGPFVAVNCPALPENLLESELFGYAKGAFTDAKSDRKGLFQEAEGGTIFLDEIGDLPLQLQAKLLRVLQEKEIKPLGQSRSLKVDVRVLASTNRDLKRQMAEGKFREDLYYRLGVVTISLPPLRERLEDLPLLVDHFLRKYGPDMGKPGISLSKEAMGALLSYEWPGNVRELENLIERMVVITVGEEIKASDLPLMISDVNRAWQPDGDILPLRRAVENLEKTLLEKALARYGSTYRVARALEINQSTVFRKAVKYGLIRVMRGR